MLDLSPSRLETSYSVEMANGRVVVADEIIRKCSIRLEDHAFDIDLIPFELGSFDVIVGMDWLSKHGAEIVCRDKVVRIPMPNREVLRIHKHLTQESQTLLESKGMFLIKSTCRSLKIEVCPSLLCQVRVVIVIAFLSL